LEIFSKQSRHRQLLKSFRILVKFSGETCTSEHQHFDWSAWQVNSTPQDSQASLPAREVSICEFSTVIKTGQFRVFRVLRGLFLSLYKINV
jgi:hypothetical protein